MSATSEDIKDMLLAETSLGLVFGTSLFVGREPGNPNDTVTIFDTPGYPPQLTMDKSEVYQYPSIQIRVRNTSYIDGMDQSQSIMDYLHGQAGNVWNGSLYTVIYSLGNPALLDWDESGRARFIINFNLNRR